jgi:hypothetical protein
MTPEAEAWGEINEQLDDLIRREHAARDLMHWARKARSEAEALRHQAEVACADTHDADYLSAPLDDLILSLETFVKRSERMVAMRVADPDADVCYIVRI